MPGPRAPLSGQFGYFALFDGTADPGPFDTLGEVWRVCELSHKPWPTGRATHGGLDGLQRLMAAHAIGAEDVRAGRFLVPPLTYRLVGRRPAAGMTVAYARLCLSYVGAVCLRRGSVGLGDFVPAALSDPDALAVARNLAVEPDANPDPNALHPVRIELELADGRIVACDAADILGSPARPLSREAARAKFTECGGSDALWEAVARLEQMSTDALTAAVGRRS
jgi:2-methylcitrate dehydratase PrpD